jgi:4-hydroxythreonine-4-phosphate dehydrogenase
LYLPPGGGLYRNAVGLGVVHVTLHCALRDVFSQLNVERIVDRCRLATGFVSDLLAYHNIQRSARIGVAALNPHGGEGGLFGREEIETIAPAVAEAQSQRLPVSGPWPCDTLMHRAAADEFDAVVAMYHDQGHIALKLLGLHAAVNITLGLPIVRTSVAHGTAFDRVGLGTADERSMVQALRAARALVAVRAARHDKSEN